MAKRRKACQYGARCPYIHGELIRVSYRIASLLRFGLAFGFVRMPELDELTHQKF